MSQFPMHHPRSRARRHFLGLAAAAGARVATVSASALGALTSSANAEPGKGMVTRTAGATAGGTPRSVPCFLRGTTILTPRGEVSHRGTQDRRLGRDDPRRSCASEVDRPSQLQDGRPSWPESVMPIRIRRHAINELTPARDLYLSPGHALLIADVLIPAKDLVNGIYDCARCACWNGDT